MRFTAASHCECLGWHSSVQATGSHALYVLLWLVPVLALWNFCSAEFVVCCVWMCSLPPAALLLLLLLLLMLQL
jgi:hypothetical protein